MLWASGGPRASARAPRKLPGLLLPVRVRGCARGATRSHGAPGRRAAAATARHARAEAETLDARARAPACERGDYAEAAERCAEALALLRGIFPAGSPQLAHEMAKLGRLYFNAR